MNDFRTRPAILGALLIAAALTTAERTRAADEPEPAPVAQAEPAPAEQPEAATAAQPEPAPAAPAPAAQPESAPPGQPEPAPAAQPEKPPPYSLPFQLRSVVAANAVRLDTALAFYEDPTTGNSGTTLVPLLLASVKVTDNFAPLVRVGVVSNSAPAGPTPSGSGFLNPVLGAIYSLRPAPSLRIGLFLGVTAPIGSGGGDSPDKGQKRARMDGILARSAMDNAMFAVNDFTVFPGVGVAWIQSGFTVQVEATVLQLTRVRGSADQSDSSKTNFTAGLHVGYFLASFLSLGVELRHQRWLSTPQTVDADKTGTVRDNTTVAFGPRFHVKLGEKSWFRPAVALVLPLDDPMKKANYKIVQLDLPFTF